MTAVGERIRIMRLEKGWTQEELGKMLGITKGAVQKYENGQIKNFKVDSIRKLCQIFELSPVYFVFDNVPDYYAKEPIEMLKAHFGVWFVDFLRNFNELNQDGKTKVIMYCKDLSLIEKYRN